MTCYLGTPQSQSQLRHRVVIFKDDYGHEIRVATNLKHLSADQIADMYKARWGIEVFFRWIKQNLNVPVLLGTTKNAVFNQLFAALMTYVVLRWLYDHSKSLIIACKSMPLIRKEHMQVNQLQAEWLIAVTKILDTYIDLSRLENPKVG
ncbi:transposase [Paenibacillus oceani]|uniref:Transposase n=1 Tax=Paenibacillus oceani TaxID=2772510 RepID=A0A927CIX6_9BACL|nr:transposase [Paenibacillus oceani]MBD2866545.1 transposase [Paenibacillus oceani]